MIETICLVASNIIHLNDSTVMVQTQDPLVTFFSQVLAVIIGGIIALVANYFLQKHSFKEQDKTNRMNQRMIAYSGLLRELHNFRRSHKSSIDLEFHTGQVLIYGSRAARYKIKEWYTNQDSSIEANIDARIGEWMTIMNDETGIEKLNSKAKHWYQFWK